MVPTGVGPKTCATERGGTVRDWLRGQSFRDQDELAWTFQIASEVLQ